jgi:hypothetical protein
MQYFLLMPGDKEEDTLNEANLLGEASFDVFWGGTALKTLMTIVDKQPELLPLVKIKTDMSEGTLNIENFLTAIQKLKIRMQ